MAYDIISCWQLCNQQCESSLKYVNYSYVEISFSKKRCKFSVEFVNMDCSHRKSSPLLMKLVPGGNVIGEGTPSRTFWYWLYVCKGHQPFNIDIIQSTIISLLQPFSLLPTQYPICHIYIVSLLLQPDSTSTFPSFILALYLLLFICLSQSLCISLALVFSCLLGETFTYRLTGLSKLGQNYQYPQCPNILVLVL